MKTVNRTFYAFRYAFILSIIGFVSACSSPVEQKNQSSVSVLGTGTVLAKPDMIRMNISLSKTAQTTKTAQEEVSKMVKQAVGVLKDFNIEDKDISTASLTFNSEYEYGTGGRRLVGQRAEQRISFSIRNIQDDSQKASQIIDRLVLINGIELNQINFDVQNSTEYYSQSRELAFQKAQEKAKQYAELSGLEVSKVLNISEEGSEQFLPINNRAMAKFEMAATVNDAGSTLLPTGELEITTKIAASFLLE
jgi:uncharacterized protein YggE